MSDAGKLMMHEESDEMELSSHLEKPRVVRTEEQKVAKIHLTIPRAEIRTVMGPGISEVIAAVVAQRIGPAGPWFSHHLKMEPTIFDFEICVPVTSEVLPVGRVVPGVLRAATVVQTVYRGPYEGLGSAWGEFEAWIKGKGYTAAEDLWERYVVGPEAGPDSSTWRTELNQPLMER